jgi:DNA modification methylase
MSRVTVHVGHVLDVLRQLPAESVQCVVTSPPYWGLRDYGVPAQVWGGDRDCVHDWHAVVKPASNGIVASAMQGETLNGASATRWPHLSQVCPRCGAWRGSVGLEPMPALYVQHVVEVAREVRRVLRPDGTLWLNMGDGYATGAGMVGNCPGGGEQGARWRGDVDRLWNTKRGYRGDRQADRKRKRLRPLGPLMQPDRMPIPGLKPKDLIGAPWRVAFALQADGWWLRADIIYAKPNPMPESVTDRPTRSHEYVFLLTRSPRYYYDADAIRERSVTAGQPLCVPDGWQTGPGAHDPVAHARRERGSNSERTQETVRSSPRVFGGSRKERTLAAAGDHTRGRVASEWPAWRNKRTVWEIPTVAFSGAHFATFPEALVLPCILAGSRPGDTVLDPFAGTGTTLAVAAKNGRDAIGIELQADYVTYIRQRLDRLEADLWHPTVLEVR